MGMNWFCSKSSTKQESRGERAASTHEIEATFSEHRNDLHWVALLITGDDELANRAIVNATELSKKGQVVFRDWLSRWAKTATARAAVGLIRPVIIRAASLYAVASSERPDHA